MVLKEKNGEMTSTTMKWMDKKVVASFFTSDDDIFIIVYYQRKASFLPFVLPTLLTWRI